MGAGVAYTTTVYAASTLRGGKTDQFNHWYAGVASGAVIGKCGN